MFDFRVCFGILKNPGNTRENEVTVCTRRAQAMSPPLRATPRPAQCFGKVGGGMGGERHPGKCPSSSGEVKRPHSPAKPNRQYCPPRLFCRGTLSLTVPHPGHHPHNGADPPYPRLEGKPRTGSTERGGREGAESPDPAREGQGSLPLAPPSGLARPAAPAVRGDLPVRNSWKTAFERP